MAQNPNNKTWRGDEYVLRYVSEASTKTCWTRYSVCELSVVWCRVVVLHGYCPALSRVDMLQNMYILHVLYYFPGKPNDTFIKGSTNFRLEAVIRHELSLVHQKAQQLCQKDGYANKSKLGSSQSKRIQISLVGNRK